MHVQQAQQQLLLQLKGLYDEREAANITDWVMEKVTGLKKMDRILRKNEAFAESALESLKKYTAELLAHRPVQYVLQESWFCGMKFYVDEQVLIPRPETEELVNWLLSDIQTATSQIAVASSHSAPYPILDVGTGSGCIAIALPAALKKSTARTPDPAPVEAQYPNPAGPKPFAPTTSAGAETPIYACDISPGALAIARRNAAFHETPIHFRQLDFLDNNQWDNLPAVQAIISNPPYIPLKDKAGMAPHVVGFEPHLALFVEDKDPLVFYRALAGFARQKLLSGGTLFVEIHEELAAEVMQVFSEGGFPLLTLKKDMQGKDRMIKATR